MTIEATMLPDLNNVFGCLRGVSHAGLAVSGGADSVALMHLAHQWRRELEADAPQLTVLSVDHGLRDGSAQEAQWVAQAAKNLDFPCQILRWQPGKKQSRIQQDARQARYDLMAGYAYENKIDALVTAHHLDDQAETVLMRLARGSGLDGLGGMHSHSTWAGLSLLRPFLDVPKQQLAESLLQRGIDWLEDPSNDDARFERVRIRQAMQDLQKLGIDATAVARSARRMRRASEALDHAAGAFLQDHAKATDTGYCRIDAKAFASAPEEIALRVLSRCIQGVGGRVMPPRLAKLESLFAVLKNNEGKTETLGGCVLRSKANQILVLREGGRRGPAPMHLDPGHSGLWDGRYRVSLGASHEAPVEVRALGQDAWRMIRKERPETPSLPPLVAAGLVSFWRDDALLAVPPLGYVAGKLPPAVCKAELVNGALFMVNR